MTGAYVIVGGTSGIGLELAKECVGQGHEVVISGRSKERAAHVAAELGPLAKGIGVDLCETKEIASALAEVGHVRHLVVAAIERDTNQISDYNLERAERLVILKLVGYSEVVHTLAPRLGTDGAIVLFGGLAKERPYPGSTTVSTVNGGISGLVRTLACELAPVRGERGPSRDRGGQPLLGGQTARFSGRKDPHRAPGHDARRSTGDHVPARLRRCQRC